MEKSRHELVDTLLYGLAKRTEEYQQNLEETIYRCLTDLVDSWIASGVKNVLTLDITELYKKLDPKPDDEKFIQAIDQAVIQICEVWTGKDRRITTSFVDEGNLHFYNEET